LPLFEYLATFRTLNAELKNQYLSFFDRHYGKLDWPFFDPNGLLPTWHLLSQIVDLPKSTRILIIGDYSLRDTLLLQSIGFKPDLVDLERPPKSENLQGAFIKASLDDSADFKNISGTYDVIVLCEVLEHLFHDCQALTFLRSKLSEKGVLVFSTPLINPLIKRASDQAPFHVQVYTPDQLNRLFARAGFSPSNFIIRGFLCNFWYSFPIRVLLWMLRKTFGERTAFMAVVSLTGKLYEDGTCEMVRWLSMWSWAYGCLTILNPVDPSQRLEELNKRTFLGVS
jgi:hypothetical protein